MLSVETLEMRKQDLTPSLAKLRYNTKAILITENL
jgi:hypothetical protein